MLVVPLVFVFTFAGHCAKIPPCWGKIGGKNTDSIFDYSRYCDNDCFESGIGITARRRKLIYQQMFSLAQNKPPTLLKFWLDLFPEETLFQAMADGNMLQNNHFLFFWDWLRLCRRNHQQRVISFQGISMAYHYYEVGSKSLWSWLLCRIAPDSQVLQIGIVPSELNILHLVFILVLLHWFYPVLLTTLAKLNPLTFLSRCEQ